MLARTLPAQTGELAVFVATRLNARPDALTAWTRAEHLALYEYFLTVARNKTAEAETWLQLATGYRAGVHKGLYDAAVPWEWQAQAARREAKTAHESAQRHRQLATITVAANVVP